MEEIKIGKYIHSKSNKLYEVIGIGRYSENLEEFVIYRGLYNSKKFGNKPLWIRPKKMFMEKVEIDGKLVLRFEFVK